MAHRQDRFVDCRGPSAGRPARRRALLLCVVIATLLAGGGWLASRSRTDPDRLWSDAERAFLAGHWDQAIAALEHLERLRAKTPLDRVLEAQIATAQERFPDALRALALVPDEHAIAPQAHLLAGRIQRQLRRLRKAEAEFRAALLLKPTLIEARKELIYILGLQSRRREVDAEFHELARSTRLSVHDLTTWALTHFTQWNPDIVADLDGCVSADPLDRDSRLAVAELLIERPEVEVYITRVLAPLPDSDPDALALRINLAFNLGRVDEAESLLARAPAGHPRLARLRGEVALRRRDVDSAIRYFREALGAEPYDRVAPMRLARALELKGDRSGGLSYLERVKRLNRVYTLITRAHSMKNGKQTSDFTELGGACEDAGLFAEATGWYTLAISNDPLDASAQEGLYRASRLEAQRCAQGTGPGETTAARSP
jgi:tetratricopeptide (TPR) repeat protein